MRVESHAFSHAKANSSYAFKEKKVLIEKIGKEQMLLQTAEECTELAQACLKMARKMNGKNPTDKSFKTLQANLEEEITDVMICLEELTDAECVDEHSMTKWYDLKKERIRKRFKTEDEV